MSAELFNFLLFFGIETYQKSTRGYLLDNGFDVQDIEILDKYLPYLSWYGALIEFGENRKQNKAFEFNYICLSILRESMVSIKDSLLQRKMMAFIDEQKPENAALIKIHIENIISKKEMQKMMSNIDVVRNNTAHKKETNKRNNKEFYIIAGANGTGKSTLAKEIILDKNANGETIEFINADEIAKEISPENVERAKIAAGKSALKEAKKMIENGKSFIFESTLSGKIKETEYSLLTNIKEAKLRGYKIKLLYIYLDNSDLCKERIKTRVLKGGHSVNAEDVVRRYKRSIKNFIEYKDIIESWVLYSNNSNKFIEAAKNTNGNIEISDEKIYNKVTGIDYAE